MERWLSHNGKVWSRPSSKLRMRMKRTSWKAEVWPTSLITLTRRGPACRLRMPTSKVWWTPSTETCRIRLIEVWEMATIKCHRGVSVPKLLPLMHCLIDLGLPKGLTDTAISNLRGQQSWGPPSKERVIGPRQSNALWAYWEASNSKTLTSSPNSYNYSGTTKLCNKLLTIIEMAKSNIHQSTLIESKRRRTWKTRNMRSLWMNCWKVWTTLKLKKNKLIRTKSTRTTSWRDRSPKTRAITRMRESMRSSTKKLTTHCRISRPSRNVSSSPPWRSQVKNLINCFFPHLSTRGRSARKWSSSSNLKIRRETVRMLGHTTATGRPKNQIWPRSDQLAWGSPRTSREGKYFIFIVDWFYFMA